MPAGYPWAAAAALLPDVSHAITGLPREVEYVYSGAEFNEAFGPLELVKIARRRNDVRRARRRLNQKRFHRRYARIGENIHKKT